MRIITKNIKKRLPIDLIQLIWNFYDEGYQGVEMDEYQFLKIDTQDNNATSMMWQEEPQAMKRQSIPDYPSCEIWIINDGDVVTMLFPEDY